MSESDLGICERCPFARGLEYTIECETEEIKKIGNDAMDSMFSGLSYEKFYETLEDSALIADLQNPGRWVNPSSLDELSELFRSNAVFLIEKKEESLQQNKERLQSMLSKCALGPTDLSVNVLGTRTETICRSSIPGPASTPKTESS